MALQILASSERRPCIRLGTYRWKLAYRIRYMGTIKISAIKYTWGFSTPSSNGSTFPLMTMNHARV